MGAQKLKSPARKKATEIKSYDRNETTAFFDSSKPLKFEDLGLLLLEQPTTQVVSIRLPTELLNKLKAMGSQKDIPYQALIKLFLANAVKKK
jgi:predicted DNA binding CopG/RHH family protein